MPSYSDEVSADAPQWWFRLEETEAEAGSTGFTDAMRATPKLTRYGTTQQVAGIVAGSPGATRFGTLTLTESFDENFDPIMVETADTGWLRSSPGTTNDWAYLSGTSVTVECWIKPDTATRADTVIVTLCSDSFIIGQNGPDLVTTIKLGQFGGAQVTRTSAGALPVAGALYHVVIVHDAAAQERRHYVNGVLLETWTGEVLASPSLLSAGIIILGHVYGNAWTGVGDEYAMYQSALSGARVLAHYEAGTAGTQSTADDRTHTIYQGAPPDGQVSVTAGDLTVAEAPPSDATIIVARAFTASNDGLGETGAGADAVGISVVHTIGEGAPGIDNIALTDDTGNTIAGAMSERGAGRDAIEVIKVEDTTPPPPVLNLQGTRAGDGAGGAIALTWDNPAGSGGTGGSGSDAVKILFDISGFPQTFIATPASSYTRTGLPNGRLITVSVRAEDAAGNASEARTVTVLTGASTAQFGAPQGVTATGLVRAVLVTWNAPSGAGAGDVRAAQVWQEANGVSRQVAQIPWGFRTAQLPVPTTHTTITHLSPGTEYGYTVRYVDRYGNLTAFSAPAATATPVQGTTGGNESYMTPTQFASITDHIAKQYLILKGTAASGYGVGTNAPDVTQDYGYSRALRTMITEILTDGDEAIIDNVYPVSKAARSGLGVTPYKTEAQQKLGAVIASLSAAATAVPLAGVSDLDSYSTYFNTGSGGTYQALHSPAFAEAYNAVNNRLLSPTNIYAPHAQTLASIAVGGAIVPGTDIVATDHAGAGRLDATTTGWAGAAGTVTVTGSARAANGTVAAGRTFTGNIAGNGTITLTPTIGGDLCLTVTAIALPGGMTAGSVAIVTAPPTGRTAPSVL